MENEIQIGTKYQTRDKRKVICTVIDIYKTYNSKGELVKTNYVAEHIVMGQKVIERDVVKTTIVMGLLSTPTTEE
jgi:hypothetical protein